ncbi:hypothetical protein M878_03740 [Streptomyces roseochromogenus subsp. oscitans DS 12.976]|uniref:Uncharacterized protein n=1 Tax=Streptomyces roseochromogenus subsp. oscitans DS 12.976 TaxID=1352936 RepID=V6KVI3_STRRC|nr:hypothetical protein M878_03740 [Streptomyces roseochromogenus subsp. oscitans DS 12.976]
MLLGPAAVPGDDEGHRLRPGPPQHLGGRTGHHEAGAQRQPRLRDGKRPFASSNPGTGAPSWKASQPG